VEKVLSDESGKDVRTLVDIKQDICDTRWTQGHRKGLEDAGILVDRILRSLFEIEDDEKGKRNGSSQIEEDYE